MDANSRNSSSALLCLAVATFAGAICGILGLTAVVGGEYYVGVLLLMIGCVTFLPTLFDRTRRWTPPLIALGFTLGLAFGPVPSSGSMELDARIYTFNTTVGIVIGLVLGLVQDLFPRRQ
jgi:uncharacterized membrane protein YccC